MKNQLLDKIKKSTEKLNIQESQQNLKQMDQNLQQIAIFKKNYFQMQKYIFLTFSFLNLQVQVPIFNDQPQQYKRQYNIADLFNQLQHTQKTMHNNFLNPQIGRRNSSQSKLATRKKSYSLRKENDIRNKNLYITPIKRPIICTQSLANHKTVKKHYSSFMFYPYEDKFFRVSGFEHVKINRARIIDWFIEICKQFDQSWSTFWMAVQLLDRLIADIDCVKVSNIHICGTVLLFISSKYVQVQPITFEKLEKDILYKKYSKEEILKAEQILLSKLLFEQKNGSLHFPTVFDKVLELCQQTTQIFVKCVFRELVYVYMAPNMALFDNTKKIREKILIRQVCDALINDERFEKAGDVQEYFLEHYGCLNVRRHSKTIKI